MSRGCLRPLTLAALSLALPGALAAQTVAPDETGTGGGPASTITAPNTNTLGVTKPPGTSLGPGEVPSREERRRERPGPDKPATTICAGCT